jgi:hypothetical protein
MVAASPGVRRHSHPRPCGHLLICSPAQRRSIAHPPAEARDRSAVQFRPGRLKRPPIGALFLGE